MPAHGCHALDAAAGAAGEHVMPHIPAIQSVGMSAVVKTQVYECNQCGFMWIPQTKDPERCPSRKCRAVDWNGPKRKKGVKLKRGPKPGRPKGTKKKGK